MPGKGLMKALPVFWVVVNHHGSHPDVFLLTSGIGETSRANKFIRYHVGRLVFQRNPPNILLIEFANNNGFLRWSPLQLP